MEPLVLPPIKRAFEIWLNIFLARTETTFSEQEKKEEWQEFKRILFNEYKIKIKVNKNDFEPGRSGDESLRREKGYDE